MTDDASAGFFLGLLLGLVVLILAIPMGLTMGENVAPDTLLEGLVICEQNGGLFKYDSDTLFCANGVEWEYR